MDPSTRCGAVQSFGVAPTRALAARVQQSWWQGAATLPMCSAYALGGTNLKWTSDQREMHTLKWEHWVTFTHGLRLNGVARQCGRADTETNLRDRTAGDGLQRDNELGCACLSKGAKCRFA